MKNSAHNNITWHSANVSRETREKQNRYKSVIVWFTGLSSSGKLTIAHAVEEQLNRMGSKTFVFDGMDSIRISDSQEKIAKRTFGVSVKCVSSLLKQVLSLSLLLSLPIVKIEI